MKEVKDTPFGAENKANSGFIKPDFTELLEQLNKASQKQEPGITAEQVIEHVRGLAKPASPTPHTFPIDVLPEAVQRIIKETKESLNYPEDYTAAAVLYAVSLAAGRKYLVKVREGWFETAVIYMVVVGRPGVGKTHPLSFILRPFEKRDEAEHLIYQEKEKEYERVMSLSKKDRLKEGYENPVKPVWKQYLLSDFTPEGLAKAHSENPVGIGVYVDELATWFNNFNRYTKGSEEQFWLSVWSNKAAKFTRKTSPSVYISRPFIPVIGGIQPGVLSSLAENRTENGFVDRLLFVLPEESNKEPWNDKELDPSCPDRWERIISRLIDEEPAMRNGQIDSRVLPQTTEAKELLWQWQRELTDEVNAEEDDTIRGILAKIETYIGRFALIVRLLRYACKEADNRAIDKEDIQAAIRLTDYFKAGALRVHSILSGEVNPLEKLPANKQDLYAALPNAFTRSEGEEIAKGYTLDPRTFYRFIANKSFFRRTSYGTYEKIF